MSAFNIVRTRVKPGRESDYLDAHRNAGKQLEGFRRGVIVKTGDRSYCWIGEWDDYDCIVNARGQMAEILEGFRDTLEELGDGLGITDPVSGESVLEVTS